MKQGDIVREIAHPKEIGVITETWGEVVKVIGSDLHMLTYKDNLEKVQLYSTDEVIQRLQILSDDIESLDAMGEFSKCSVLGLIQEKIKGLRLEQTMTDDEVQEFRRRARAERRNNDTKTGEN